MAQYVYEARTDEGQLVSGTMAATSVEEAGQKLCRQGHFVVRIGPANSAVAIGAGRDSSANRQKMGRRKVMWFMNQLSIMIQTGITLGDSLDSLSKQSHDPQSRAVIVGVSEFVHEGRPLSDAMDAYPRTFPLAVTAMVRASEASGTLAQVLGRTAQYMLKDEQAVQRLRGAMVYPAFALAICACVTLFLITVILPKFAQVYGSKGATLPLPTRVLMGGSSALIAHWPLIVGTAGAAAVALFFWLRTRAARFWLDGALLRLPVVGNLLNKLYQSRSFRSIGTLIDVGVPLNEVLTLTGNMSTNHRYRELWRDVQTSVTNGEHIAAPMVAYPMIPEPVRQMIDCGDRAGRLGQVFDRLASFIEEEYEQAMKNVCQLLEPALIVVLGGVIGFVAIALLLPMFRSASIAAH